MCCPSLKFKSLILIIGLIVTLFLFATTYWVLHRMENVNNSVAILFAVGFSFLLTAPPYIFYQYNQKLPSPGVLGIFFVTAVSIPLVASYLYRTSHYISIHADLLMWAESPFVDDIIKLRIGHVLYTPPDDNNSFSYHPGAQILTYVIARLFGQGASIPFFRIIQLGYVLVASILATVCCVKLTRLCLPPKFSWHPKLWMAMWMPILFLIATAPTINHYNYCLHGDALALLVSIAAFWLLLTHATTRNDRLLVAMAIIPAVGFVVKQSLAIWALLYIFYLILDQPRAIRRTIAFALGSLLVIVGITALFYFLWGDPYIYWVFMNMGNHQISLWRSLTHLRVGWAFIVLGLVGGWILLRGDFYKRLSSLWLCWLLLFLVEVYTSGIGWDTNHLGPGGLIASIWFLTALVKIWPNFHNGQNERYNKNVQTWLHAGIAVGIMVLLFNKMDFDRIPVNPVSSDLTRYIREIEQEFQGIPPDQVLLDAGSWIYLRHNVLLKDRSDPVAVQTGAKAKHFAMTRQRITEKKYTKILVRLLYTNECRYDWRYFLDGGSTGIKTALLENYHETHRIRGVEGKGIREWHNPRLISEITVLEPNVDECQRMVDHGPASH
ncbi:MAG: hypothetical protein ACFFCW_01115 [Candidatus Hodarchaeota archaeon]